jgi:hypothetical protein
LTIALRLLRPIIFYLGSLCGSIAKTNLLQAIIAIYFDGVVKSLW